MRTFLIVLLGALPLSADKAPGPSVSVGRPSHGRIKNASALPLIGAGFRMLRQDGGRNFGTADLIEGLQEVAATLAAADPDIPPLTIGDISAKNGGGLRSHRSHQSGRDVDIVFYWTDRLGRPVTADAFVRFDLKGRSRDHRPPVLFDAARNWALIKALLTNRRFGDRVLYLFISRHLKDLMVQHARAVGESAALVERAARVMSRSGRGVRRHDNHVHLRVACSPADKSAGCRED